MPDRFAVPAPDVLRARGKVVLDHSADPDPSLVYSAPADLAEAR